MGVDQPECGAGRASPAKWPNTNTGKTNSQAVDRRAVGCKLVVLKMACSQSPGCRLQFGGAEKSPSAITLQNSSTIFRHAVRAIQGA
jgi:hypothetical protein